MASAAYGYVRHTCEDAMDLSGFERQRQTIIGYAEKHCYEIVHFYKEVDVTDFKKGMMSPAFQEMVSE